MGRTRFACFVLFLAFIVLVNGCDHRAQFGSQTPGFQQATGVVSGIIDGDTFTIRYTDGGSGLPLEIRPYLLNAPETHDGKECFGDQATSAASELLTDKMVWLTHLQKESYNRLLAFVYLDPERTQLFAAAMIGDGYARLDARHPEEEPFVNELQARQIEAEQGPRGMWERCAKAADLALDNVVINELEQNPPGNDTGHEWVELFNPTDVTVDLTGWTLRATHGNQATIGIPTGTLLEPKAFGVFSGTGQVLDNEDEVVVLIDAIGREVDRTPALSDTENMESKGTLRCNARVPDGDVWEFQTCSAGKSNGALRFDPSR